MTDSYIIPAEIRSGDTTSWKRNNADYPPADGWTLKYYLTDQTNAYTITATDDGTDYLVDITAAGSAAWVPGTYRYAEFVENGSGDCHTTASGNIEILPNLATAVAYDTRTDARIIYDSLIAAYKDFISTNGVMSSFSIGGKAVTFKSASDILDQIRFWHAEVQNEADAEAVAAGTKASRRRVGTRFERI